jgi:hypothetical protein
VTDGPEQLRLFCPTCGGGGRLTAGVVAATGQLRGSRPGPNGWPSRALDCSVVEVDCPDCRPRSARDVWSEAVGLGRFSGERAGQ